MKHTFTKENAREMQLRSAKAQRENTARRKMLRELLMDELSKPIKDGSRMTKLEWLIAKAVGNERDNASLDSLLKLQELLGERHIYNNINLTAGKSAEDCGREILEAIGE